MDNINFGVVNYIVANNTISSVISESKDYLDKSNKFINLIKNNPILESQFHLYESIENAHAPSEVLALDTINENINNFNSVEYSALVEANQQLKEFMDDTTIDSDRFKLYESINTLIINKVTENYIKTSDIIAAKSNIIDYLQREITESESELNYDGKLHEHSHFIIDIATNKFNEEIDSLNEDDRNMIKLLINEGESHEEIFNTIKSETIQILENEDNDEIKEQINEAINHIKSMSFTKDNSVNDILSVYQLKSDLLS